ncbi:MAG: DNA-binding transcriptional regulator BolA [Chlamydiia bacterium]|nr:DNA-binding transcriptional regulator BolA [Chlamydiia bacterium]
METIETQIKQVIQGELPDASITILDPREDGRHLEAVVISDDFEGKAPLARQRGIMSALRPLFADALHALALHTYTPTEWETYGKDRHPL